NDAPTDHDPRKPPPRADAIEDHVARHFEEAVPDEQDARAAAELRRRQSDLAIHRKRREPDVVAIEVIEDVRDRQDRQEPPRNFVEDPIGVWRDRLHYGYLTNHEDTSRTNNTN